MFDREKTSIIIYTTSWCGPCKSAKRFLSDHGFDFKEIDIEKENISREQMASMTKGLQVPQIVINGEPIGGFEDLVKYFDENL